MTSEGVQRPGGGEQERPEGGGGNKLHMGFFFFEKAVQQGSVAHAKRLVGNGGDEGSAKVGKGQAVGGRVRGFNGRCGVWPRVADRFMNGD